MKEETEDRHHGPDLDHDHDHDHEDSMEDEDIEMMRAVVVAVTVVGIVNVAVEVVVENRFLPNYETDSSFFFLFNFSKSLKIKCPTKKCPQKT